MGLGICTKHMSQRDFFIEIRLELHKELQVSAPIGFPQIRALKNTTASVNGSFLSKTCMLLRLIRIEAAAIAGNKEGKSCLYHKVSHFAQPFMHMEGFVIKSNKNTAEKRVEIIEVSGRSLNPFYAG